MALSKKDNRQELLVAGYIRNVEKSYQMNIPGDITDIIYLYQRIYDEWIENMHLKILKLMIQDLC